MIILAIETSCDDTGISILKISTSSSGGEISKLEVKSNIISSQTDLHQEYGGVYPTLAKREHQKALVPALKKTLKQSKILKTAISAASQKPKELKLKKLKNIFSREKYLLKELNKFLKENSRPKIDAIAVTEGPGLEPCLWVGINFAKALSYCWNLPVIAVNHIESHLLANFIEKPQILKSKKEKLFPAIGLVISGGNTQIILMKEIGNYKIIGETQDDAAGECFDKTARVLGLPYPGGPSIANEAAKSKNNKNKFQIDLPRPMLNHKNYDFSFSGLKTAVLYSHKKRIRKERNSAQYIAEMSKEIQQAIIDVLIKKTIKAAKDYQAKSILIGGGVAANQELRKQFILTLKNKNLNFKFLVPLKKHCTDNAAMIGLTAYFHQNEAKPWKNLQAQANLRL